MDEEKSKRNKKIVYSMFILLGVLFVVALFINRKRANASQIDDFEQTKIKGTFQENIIDNLDDTDSEEFQKSMFYYLTHFENDPAKTEVILSYLKSHPNDKLIQNAFKERPVTVIEYLCKLDKNSIKSILFKSINFNPHEYIQSYKAEICGPIDNILVNEYPEYVSTIKKSLPNYLDDANNLKNVVEFLRINSLLDKKILSDLTEFIAAKNDIVSLPNSLDNKIERQKELVGEVNDAYLEFSKIISLRGFMISKRTENSYEIRVNGSPALLETEVSGFSSKGWFLINALRNGYQPVQLKQEYGGFDQRWPLFTEVTQEYRDEKQQRYYDLKNEVIKIKNEINEISKNVNKAKNIITVFQKKYSNPKLLIEDRKAS